MPVPVTDPFDPVKSIEVQLIKFGQQLRLSEEFVADVKTHVCLDRMLNDIVVNFTRKIPAICSPDIQVPLTWWDHFKEQFFREHRVRLAGWVFRVKIGGYLRNRFPIQYRTLQARMFLPELPLPSYKGERFIHLAEISRFVPDSEE